MTITDWTGCGDALMRVFIALLYPLGVPALSIYYAARELFWGKDKEEDLNEMKGLKMFEHLGQYFLFSILSIKVLISRRGRPTADTADNIHHQQRRSHCSPFFCHFRWDFFLD